MVLHAHDEARKTQSALAHGGLDGFLAIGLGEGLGVGQRAVRTFPLAPADAPREEPAVGPIELGVVVSRQAPRGAPV